MNISLNKNVKVLKKDDVLFKEGDDPKFMYLVMSGKIVCLKQAKERFIPVYLAEDQSIIGEEAALTSKPYAYSAIATEPAEVIQIDANLVKNVLEAAPHWINDLLVTFGDRASETQGAIAEHRILHSDLSGGQELTPQEETRFKKLLN
jgi:CRP-like cAMP-binding protein